MKRVVAAKKIDWEAECERIRQRCNRLSDDERRALREKALRLIYHSDAEAVDTNVLMRLADGHEATL